MYDLLTDPACNADLIADADTGVKDDHYSCHSNTYDCMNISGWYVVIHDLHNKCWKKHGQCRGRKHQEQCQCQLSFIRTYISKKAF